VCPKSSGKRFSHAEQTGCRRPQIQRRNGDGVRKEQINKVQNGASKNIYQKKYNAKTQPQAQPKP
jgi:hypothetical protein